MDKTFLFHLFHYQGRLLAAFILGLSLLLSVFWWSNSLPPVEAQAPAGQKVLIDAVDEQTFKELAASGATLLVDYGAFSLWRVSQAQVAAVSQQSSLQSQPDFDEIPLRGGQVIKTGPGKAVVPAVPDKLRQNPVQAEEMWLVQFIGPVREEWLNTLTEKGQLEIVGYLPNNAYIVWGKAAHEILEEIARANSFIQWLGPYHPAYRLEPSLQQAAATQPVDEPVEVTVQFYTTSQTPQSLARLQSLSQTVRLIMPVLNFTNITLVLPAGRLVEVANWPDVYNVEPWVTPQLYDERQDQILAGNISGSNPSGPGYLNWLATKGFTQTGQFNFVVDVTDSGIDNGTTAANHFGLYTLGNLVLASRVVYNRLEGTPHTPSTIQGADGHGNINAHIIAGFNNRTGFPHADGSGFRYGLGMAPFVKVGGSVIFDPSLFTSPNFNNLQARAYNDGARISSNSWGASVAGAYTSSSQAYDALVRDAQPAGSVFSAAGNQEMVIVFAAGNDGPGANTMGAPGTGKNVLTVGASENVQAFGGADASGIDDTGANSLNDIIGFSSRGPLDDGRVKPDLVGPGTHISGGAWQQNPLDSGNGLADSAFDGSGVSGGVGSIFFPNGQQFYTASSGTSHSTPAIAGGAALLRQYFINQGLTPPSPAMSKAYLVNTTRYLTGVDANDILFSNNQGMGLMNLGMAFDGVARFLRDQVFVERFTATGQARSYTGVVSDPSKPFRVSLAWTDAPGATVGNAFNNNLNLIVNVGGNTYRGNVFSGATSTPGGAADPRNNIENVFLPAGVSGPYTVTVQATNINSDGVPNTGGALDQDFALVIYNANPTIQPLVVGAGYNLLAENFAPANGVPDPGEQVTANFVLQNIGTGNTSNLVATLQPTGGVIPTTTTQTYGALPALGAPVGRPFTFRVDPALACGGTLTATLQLQNGAANLGTVAFGFTLGTTVTGPTLVFANTGAVTTPAGAPASTNGAAAPYPAAINVSGLISPVSKVTVTLTSVAHTFPDDLDILLVGPGGQKVMLMSDAGGGTDISSATLIFDDAAAGGVPDTGSIPAAGGIFRPTDFTPGDSLPGPAPTGPYGTALSAFSGVNPNGAWSLYVNDDATQDSGGINGGWRVGLTLANPVCANNLPSIYLPIIHKK
ncbi:MAG: S8 family serine peptidase [Anaerolineae bacterium]|nr:S8 family serine peptidase [Anaerolineae bacterium]